MLTADYINEVIIPATFARFVPDNFGTIHAHAMLMAIALQESKLTERFQIRGPARGWWQFEENGGTIGVLKHSASAKLAREVCRALDYPALKGDIQAALAHNDILACSFARLLLWTHPKPLPERDANAYAWQYYLDTWRPGKPHITTWPNNFAEGWRYACAYYDKYDAHTI